MNNLTTNKHTNDSLQPYEVSVMLDVIISVDVNQETTAIYY